MKPSDYELGELSRATDDQRIQRLQALIQFAEVGKRLTFPNAGVTRFVHHSLDFILRHLRRLERYPDEEADLFAWVARSLFELMLLVLPAQTPDDLTAIVAQKVNDYEHLYKTLSDPSVLGLVDDVTHGNALDSAEMKELDATVNELHDLINKGGVALSGPERWKSLAKKIGREPLYTMLYPSMSKLVHPSSAQIFSGGDFWFGEETRRSMLVIALHSASETIRHLIALEKKSR